MDTHTLIGYAAYIVACSVLLTYLTVVTRKIQRGQSEHE